VSNSTLVNSESISGVADGQASTLHRKIGWKGAFWVASGVPALVLFSIGAVAATVGKPSWLVWLLSISFGFIQAFTYAEIAGLFPNKSGGASVYGAVAWVRYSKFIAPISVWCNWLAWTPVLSIGSGLAAGYILTTLFPADSIINTWQFTLLDLDHIKTGLSLRINSTFILGATVLLTVFSVQHGGILRSARVTTILGVTALIPLILIGLVPLITGDAPSANFLPLVPISYDTVGNVVDGSWNISGWTLMAGGLFIAGWSSYAFETAVCYTREFKNPKTDTYKAILYAGLLCILVYTFVPMAFQGHLGLGQLVTPAVVDSNGAITTAAVYSGMLSPDIYSGMGVATVMSSMIKGGPIVEHVIIVMLVMSLALAIMTSMAGSSRTLYQASIDGWLPKYLSHVNEHGAPTRAMWTDLSFNLLLLMMSDYVFVLAVSNVSYMIFIFLNLNAGWIHRIDRPNWERPYKAPTYLLWLGGALSFVNLALMGMGADIWGAGTLKVGLVFSALILPVFIFRHYIQDKGVFPAEMVEDMHLSGNEEGVSKKAGVLPYITLIAAVLITYYFHSIASI
jgi:amino acid transporter